MIAADIAGDREAAERVELVLPETGVCNRSAALAERIWLCSMPRLTPAALVPSDSNNPSLVANNAHRFLLRLCLALWLHCSDADRDTCATRAMACFLAGLHL